MTSRASSQGNRDAPPLDLRTLNDVFFRVAARGDGTAMLRRDSDGVWKPISGAELYRSVLAFSDSLLRLGVVKGDRIALLAENRWEWAVADFAALAIGAVSVPIYSTLTADQTGVMLADSGSSVVVVSTRKQYEKVASFRAHIHGHLKHIAEHVIVMDEENLPGLLQFTELIAPAVVPSASSPGSPRRTSEAFDLRARDVLPEDLATIIYTSGTTGEPKGVMLTHGNLASNLNYSSREFEFTADDTCISFLPLSHVTARHLDYVLLARGATLAYCPFFEQLPAAMTSVRPTVFVAVPRVYEKIMQEVKRRAARSAVKARLLHSAVSIGRRHRKTVLEGSMPASPLFKLAQKVVFSKVRQVFGGRVRYFVSGGAPLGLDTAEWFADAGIQLLEGYGLTETSPLISLNTPVASRIGSVGKLMPNIEARIADDGELLVRGPSVFEGYWQKPEATAEVFELSGPREQVHAQGEVRFHEFKQDMQAPNAPASGDKPWFRTGDIARLEDGFLFITDRKKELLKTSGGKMIAPQPIETRLKADTFVAHATLVGDRHKFACALISPNFAALEEWAEGHQIPAPTRHELVQHPQVKALYHRIIQATNAKLANFEKVKRFYIVPDEWSIETGEMTPSMKVKRRVILDRYAREIARFYADEATAQLDSPH